MNKFCKSMFLESLFLAPPPLYWLLCPKFHPLLLCNLSTQLCFLSALPALSIFSVIAVASLALSKLPLLCCYLLFYFRNPFRALLCSLPTLMISLASAAFPMITLLGFSLWFLCPLWLPQLSLELTKPQKDQRLISVWISTQTCEYFCQFFTETSWIWNLPGKVSLTKVQVLGALSREQFPLKHWPFCFLFGVGWKKDGDYILCIVYLLSFDIGYTLLEKPVRYSERIQGSIFSFIQ